MAKSKNSRYVVVIRDEDGITISALAINGRSKYTIEFNSREELEFIFNSYPIRGFEGFFASFNDRYENEKAYVDITFKKISRAQYQLLGRDVRPHFRLNLTEKDVDLARNVFNQLNSQALQMQEDRFCIFNK